MFSQNLLGTNDFKAMQVLRERYRNWNYLNISEAENPTKESMTAIPNLTKFLDYIGFVSEQKGVLQSAEMEYLTGGWFEEYVYALIKEVLKPDDIAMGVHISNGVIKHKKTAKYMGITFCDWLNLTKPELLKNILKSMDSIAKENRSVGTNFNS